MSETRRKKPAGINMDKLDSMFMPKGGLSEPELAPVPVKPSASTAPPSEPRAASRKPAAAHAREAGREVVYLPMPSHIAPVIPGTADEDLIITTIRYPREVGRQMDEWLSANPGHSKTSLLLNGLRALGIPIADEHLVPKRARGAR